MSKRAVLAGFIVVACAIALIVWLRQRSYDHYNAGEVTTLETPRESASAIVEPQPAQPSKKEPAGHPMDDAPAMQPAEQPHQTVASEDPSPIAQDNRATAGSGRFQAYRQGNLTWRMDTENGTACVLFATDEEWQKPRVSRRACAQN